MYVFFPRPQGYVQETRFLKSWQSKSIYGNEMIVDDFSHTLQAVEPPRDHYFQKVAFLLPFCSWTAGRTWPPLIPSCVPLQGATQFLWRFQSFSFCLSFFFFSPWLYGGIIDIQHCVGLRCTTCWFGTILYCKTMAILYSLSLQLHCTTFLLSCWQHLRSTLLALSNIGYCIKCNHHAFHYIPRICLKTGLS